jgi:DNA-binding transcriptional LysR family regulator
MNAAFDFKKLQHMVLLSEELNFTRAAERANLSQTAFSRSIQAAEAAMGLPIFDRGTRSVQLTAAGKRIVASARKVLSGARDLNHEIDAVVKGEGGELRFGATLLGLDGAAGRVLPLLRERSPGLQLHVEVAHGHMLPELLKLERIEFFVSYPGPLPCDPLFTMIPLRPQPASVFCRAMHPLATERPHPRQLPRYPWAAALFPEEAAPYLRALFDMSPNEPLPLALSCNNQAILREAVLTSDTLLLTWSAWLQADIQAGTIIDLAPRCNPSLPADTMQLAGGIFHLADRTLSPSARRLIDLISERDALSQPAQQVAPARSDRFRNDKRAEHKRKSS